MDHIQTSSPNRLPALLAFDFVNPIKPTLLSKMQMPLQHYLLSFPNHLYVSNARAQDLTNNS